LAKHKTISYRPPPKASAPESRELQISLRIYSKPGCHLCELAKDVLGRFAKRYPLSISEINIEDDPQLFERFKDEIPVVFVGDQKLFKYRIDEDRLKTALESRLKIKR
jgi:thiol-disulfide isomerase/thioredoxin